MPFKLSNTGEMYQRLVDRVFEQQIGRNVEVYFDDMVIKTKEDNEFLRDIEDKMVHLRETNMKLNPKKCVFEVYKGRFLGQTMSTQGIKANQTKLTC